MAFLAPLAASALGYFGQQQANAQTANAQSSAQQQAQQYAQGQNQMAQQYSGQGLQQALQNLGQYQKQNPAPVNQLGAIGMPGAAGGQALGTPQQSFGGGQVGGPTQGMVPGMPPGGGMRPPGQPQQQMPQQNLQGAMAQPQGQSQGQPQAQQFQRLQQLYPLMQQMLAAGQGGSQAQAMPMARSTGGAI